MLGVLEWVGAAVSGAGKSVYGDGKAVSGAGETVSGAGKSVSVGCLSGVCRISSGTVDRACL